MKQQKCGDRCFGNTFFSPRPQDSNSAKRLLAISHEEHVAADDEYFAWGFDLSIGVQQSFAKNNNLLAQWFLFNGNSYVTVGIPSDDLLFDVDGRQFGVITPNNDAGLIGTLSLDPKIKNVVADLNFWFDLNKYVQNFWLRTHFTLVRTSHHLNMCEELDTVATSSNYAAGNYTIDCKTTPLVYTSITDAFIGDRILGDIPALHFGKYYCGDLHKTALASIRVDASFDVIKTNTGFLNLGICLVMPTGTRPNGRYVFEPVVGANKSWQLGGILSGSYEINSHVSFYGDITLAHLFKAKQTRVFGLKNGAGSQYLLLKEFDLDDGVVLAGQRVANLLAGETKIGVNFMMDASLMLHCTHNNFFADFGYNFWIRSHETIADEACFRNFTRNTYGIKGDTVLSEIDDDSGFCIGSLTTERNTTISKPGAADTDTVFLDTCDIDASSALHPSAFSNKIFVALGYSKELINYNSTCYGALEGEVEFGQKNKALDQWGVSVILGSSF